jgi:hypothetical protein
VTPIETIEFLEWAAERGVVPEGEHEPPECLTFARHQDWSRFWSPPEHARQFPFFIQPIIRGLEPWQTLCLWMRGGTWPQLAGHAHVYDRIAHLIRTAGGVPSGFVGALGATRDETDAVIAIMFAQMVFGSSTADDLFVVPDNGRAILYVDHHDVIHADFADEPVLQRFVQHMTAEDFPLPTDLPDWTFKRPDWMQRDERIG